MRHGQIVPALPTRSDLLLPPSLRDWLPENHLVYFVSDVVDQLDLSALEAHYRDELRWQTALRSSADDEVADLRLLCWGVQLAQDSEAIAGGCLSLIHI